MKCPYCEKEMESGVLQSIRDIFWTSKKKKVFLTVNKHKGDIEVAPLDFIGSAVKEAFFCRNCQKIIIDVDTKEK